jgi:hypothetical protein
MGVSNSQNAQGIEGVPKAATPQAGPERGGAEPRIARSPHSGDAPSINSTFGLL